MHLNKVSLFQNLETSTEREKICTVITIDDSQQ